MASSDHEDSEEQTEYIREIAFIAPDIDTTCDICQAEFLDSEDLNIHLKQVHNESEPSVKNCQFCIATYTDLEDYAHHVLDVHLPNLKCCSCCCKAFIDTKKAKKHERKHVSKNKMFSCSQCNGLFMTAKEVELHEGIYHDNSLDGVLLICMPYLTSILNLKAVTLLQSEERVFMCCQCDFTSLDLTVYLQHLKDDNCSGFVCDNCGDIFKLKKHLVSHLNNDSIDKCVNPKENANKHTHCPNCNKEMIGQLMQAHLKVCKTYACRTCDIKFTTIEQLSAHQSENHSYELDIVKCKYCWKEFASEHAVDKHIERAHKPHFHEYKYECKSCGAIFKHPQKLFSHYFTKHQDLNPYMCKLCNEKFRVRKRFTIHIKLMHKGSGFVEFDSNYHVYFTDKKSDKPFIPKCVIPEELHIKDAGTKNTSQKTAETQQTDDADTSQSLDSDKKKINPQNVAKPKNSKHVVSLTSSDEEEAESLLVIKKRADRKKFQKQHALAKKVKSDITKQKLFTCKTCNKYCYTYQNYHNHIKIHSKNKSFECIKCSEKFPSKKELTKHISTAHATSKLIETLKTVLGRKQDETPPQPVVNDDSNEIPQSKSPQSFLKTIKKVKMDKTVVPAKISIAPNNLSVQKFIENFMPEVNESKDGKLGSKVTVKPYNSPFMSIPMIKLTKFVKEPANNIIKLKMPEKCNRQEEDAVQVNIKLVHQPVKKSMFEVLEQPATYEDNFQDFDYGVDYKDDAIPDVAHEVMLEGSEEHPKQVQAPQKIVIPKLPAGYKNIHIATLQPQAPYFKIIKVKQTGNFDEPIVIDTSIKKDTQEIPKGDSTDKEEFISLPDGTKFVPANPLAHLLDKPVEVVMAPLKNRHYTPAIVNMKGKLEEALQKLDMPRPKKRKSKIEKINA